MSTHDLQRGLARLLLGGLVTLVPMLGLAQLPTNVLRPPESETQTAPRPIPQESSSREQTPAATETPAAQELTPSSIEARRAQAEGAADLDEETKKKIAELYRQAAAHLTAAAERAKQATDSRTSAESAQNRVAAVKQQLEEEKQKLDRLNREGHTDFEPQPLPSTELEQASAENVDAQLIELKRRLASRSHERTQLQQEIAKRRLDLQQLKEAQTKTDADRTARPNRRKEIRTQELELPNRLQQLQTQLDTSPPADEPPLLTEAKRTELEAYRLATERELRALQAELAAIEAEEATNYLTLKSELSALQVARATKELELLDARLREARDRAEALAVQVAHAEFELAHDSLKDYAKDNQKWTSAARDLTPQIDEADARLEQARKDLETLKQKFEQTKNKVDTIGLTHAIGAQLRKERSELPDVRRRRDDLRRREEEIDEAQVQYFQYDDDLAELNITQTERIEKIVDEAQDETRQAQEELRAAAERVLDRQKEILAVLRSNYNRYFDKLVELSSTEQQIIKLSQQFGKYLDERVLWIRSSRRFNLSALLDSSEPLLDESDRGFLKPSNWFGVGALLWSDLQRGPARYFAVLVVLAALLHLGRRLRREIKSIGEQVVRGSFQRFQPTMRAASITLLISIPWPCFLAFLAWRLLVATGGEEFCRALGYGCYAVAVGFFPLELFRQLCRSRGLAEAHFGWPTSALLVLRRNLRFLMLTALPLGFVIATLYASEHEHDRDDFLERSVFILQAIVLASFLRRTLRPGSGVFHEYLAYHQGGWLDRLKHVWYWLAVVSPLSLGLLVFAGYYYTATQLSWRLFITACLVVGLLVVHGFLFRLLLVHHRRVSIQQLRERRESAQAAESNTELAAASPPIPPPADEADDLRTQTKQSGRLLTTLLVGVALAGVWMTWVDVLPALSLLDRWPLWTTTTQVTEVVETTTGEKPQTRTQDVVDNVTIVDLAFGILIGIMTLIPARNLPGLMEIMVLQRLPLDNSVRYAITTLASYAIAFIGIMVACRMIGLRWQQIQWLATALTFGLAFGLQEMFANFVAGVILLFERPIRVGDVVTVSDVTGVVSRIRIRATTITNWDRKEFVVPNKEFITGRLLNWTLTDQVNRIVIEIGIAYGSDTEKAKQLLLKVAQEHELVLDEPKTVATFEGFGDNSLTCCLRTFLPSLENRLQVIHELHTAIDREFRAAGIEIAFPQRDLHIRSVPASWGQQFESAENTDGANGHNAPTSQTRPSG